MKYTGRMIAILIVLLGTVAWSLFCYMMLDTYSGDQKPLSIVLLGTILQFIVSWWLGKQYDQAKFHSEKDFLTNTYNRRFVYEIYPKLASQLERNNNQISVSIIDIDDFKQINDLHGHKMGDQVLQQISSILMDTTRQGDIVSRWGGDEFLVISAYTSDNFQEIFNQRLLNKLKNSPIKIDVSISVGSAIFPIQAKQLDQLIQIADDNMYKIKWDKKETN